VPSPAGTGAFLQLNAKRQRIGTRGQQMVHLFDNESQAINLFLDVLRENRKRGYRPKGPVDIQRI
jgi:predicted DNA-binding WGR domain protein